MAENKKSDQSIFSGSPSPWGLELDHKGKCVVFKYSESFLEDYDRYMKQITKYIDWCVKKSFHMSDTERP